MTRPRLTVEVRQQQLIETGLEIFGSTPFDRVSMDLVAERAGASRTLLYHYFSDKRQLYLAVLQMVADRMLAATTVESDRPPLERFRTGLAAYLEFAEKYPEGYTTLIAGGNGSDEAVRELCEAARWRGLGEILRTLGVEDPPPALKICLRGWQGFQEGATIEWLKRRDLPRERLLDLIANALVASLQLLADDDPVP